jgi:uncharacterized protein (UPF0261 family)
MHSLVDIVGINDISKSIFDNAIAAIIGMAKAYRPMEIKGKKNVAISANGTVQKALNSICPQLIKSGYQPIMFHASGVGGRIMEDFIESKTFCGVIELALCELTDNIVGGFHDAGPIRLEAAGRMGVSQVIVPGCVDFIGWGPIETIPEKWRNRKRYYHNPAFTLIRPSYEEMREVAKGIVEKLNRAIGKVTVILPLKGLSIGGLRGGSSYDPEGDQIFFGALKNGLSSKIKIYELDCHINEEILAQKVIEEFLKMM